MYEEWQFNYEDRIFATPVITLPIVEKAIEELEWCVERGAKTVLIRPAPVPGFQGSRSFGYPEFDPFWQAVVDADILVSMHSSDSGYARYTSDWTGPSEMLPFRLDSFTYMTGGHRPIQDTMAAFVCHGVFARFPDLRVASIEAGGEWIPAFVNHLGDTYKKMPNAFDGDPVAQFKNNVYVSPFHEDDLGRDHRRHRRGPRAVRVRLAAPRGPGRAVQLRRPPARGPGRRGRAQHHGRQPGPDHAGRAGRRRRLIRPRGAVPSRAQSARCAAPFLTVGSPAERLVATAKELLWLTTSS